MYTRNSHPLPPPPSLLSSVNDNRFLHPVPRVDPIANLIDPRQGYLRSVTTMVELILLGSIIWESFDVGLISVYVEETWIRCMVLNLEDLLVYQVCAS